MVKLYYTPTSCGAASFIAAVAGQVNIQTEQVDIREHKTASGADFYEINPKGNVPALILDDGTLLNENIAVLQYIADLVCSSFFFSFPPPTPPPAPAPPLQFPSSYKSYLFFLNRMLEKLQHLQELCISCF